MPQKSTIDKVFQRSTIPLSLSDALDDASPLLKVNDGFCAMTGYESGECVGRNRRFLQGEDRDQVARFELKEALRHQKDTEVVLRNYTKCGKGFDNLLFVHHIRDLKGRVVYILGSQFVVRDRLSAETLNMHLDELDTGFAQLTESHRAVEMSVKRQLSATASTMLHSAVLKDRLSLWLEE